MDSQWWWLTGILVLIAYWRGYRRGAGTIRNTIRGWLK